MMKKFSNKTELSDWIYNTLEIDLPDRVVGCNTTCPLDMVWMVYESALNKRPLAASYISPRCGYKTLTGCISFFLLASHFDKNVMIVSDIYNNQQVICNYLEDFCRKVFLENQVESNPVQKFLFHKNKEFTKEVYREKQNDPYVTSRQLQNYGEVGGSITIRDSRILLTMRGISHLYIDEFNTLKYLKGFSSISMEKQEDCVLLKTATGGIISDTKQYLAMFKE